MSRRTGTFQGQLFHRAELPAPLRPNGSLAACTAGGSTALIGWFVHYRIAPRGARPPTTTPHPPLPEASGFRWGLPYLLPTPLRILQEASRVRHGRLKQNDVGGVFLAAP